MRIPGRALIPFALLLAVALASPAEAVKRRAFVTSATGSGNLASWADAGGAGALDAADNVCQALAAAVPLPNAGNYRAWLSTATTDAYCHVQGMTGEKASGCVGTPVPAGPWYRVNGTTPLTGTLDELVGPDKVIYQAVRYDEQGTLLDETDYYWTGTSSTGEGQANLCSSWVVGSSAVHGGYGSPSYSGLHWTSTQSALCSEPHRLLCLETGPSEATEVGWSPSALAFVTSTYGTGNLSGWLAANGHTGLAAGDAICRNLATEAHLPAPESFVAWLSNPVVDAKDRLTLNNVAYRRVDAFRVAISKASLLSSGAATSLHVDERGRYIAVSPAVLTGTTEAGVEGAAHCQNWSNGTSDQESTRGYASHAYDGTWTDHTEYGCDQPGRLYCFSNKVTIFWDGFDLTGDLSRWSSDAP